MMVKARKNDDREPVADNAARDMSRLAEASSKLFAEQAAAMAMMTAYGMSVAAQMTGMMLGALRGPAPTEKQEEPVQSSPSPVEPKTAAKVVELRPRAPKVAEGKSIKAAEAAAKPTRAARAVKAKALATRAARPTAATKASGQPSVSDRDDLKKISGIGPRLEQELHARGITRYADIAALSKAAVKKLDDELGLEGRILRDDWAGQAKALSGGKG